MYSDEDDLLIVVDHREVQSGIVDHLEQDNLFVVRKTQLSCGDYLIGDANSGHQCPAIPVISVHPFR